MILSRRLPYYPYLKVSQPRAQSTELFFSVTLTSQLASSRPDFKIIYMLMISTFLFLSLIFSLGYRLIYQIICLALLSNSDVTHPISAPFAQSQPLGYSNSIQTATWAPNLAVILESFSHTSHSNHQKSPLAFTINLESDHFLYLVDTFGLTYHHLSPDSSYITFLLQSISHPVTRDIMQFLAYMVSLL